MKQYVNRKATKPNTNYKNRHLILAIKQIKGNVDAYLRYIVLLLIAKKEN